MIRRLLLWDIDGTLLRAGSVGADIFDQALMDVIGVVPSGRVRMSGKTDPLIVHEQLALLGMDPDPDTVAAILGRLADRLEAAAGEVAERGSACPGVVEVLTALAADPEIHSGVLTGNLEPNAVVKLSAFGLDRLVDVRVGAYGSDDIDRDALVPIALDRARRHLGVDLAPESVWVVGDTPRDLGCARAAGANCLLVATGGYTASELAVLGADATLDDLTDTDAVVKLLTADL